MTKNIPFFKETVNLVRRLPRISLRFVLVVPFVAQIALAVGFTGYWSLRNGQTAIEQLAIQLGHEVSERVGQHLDSYLAPPHQVNQVNAQSIRRRILNPRDLRNLGQYFLEQMKVYPDFAYINFGDPQGNLVGINRDRFGNLQLDITEPPHLGTFYSYSLDKQGKPTKLLYKVPYEHRSDAWYTDAIKAKKPIWSQIYFWDDDQVLALSASYPIYDDRQKLIGVIGIDYLLHRISHFLHQIKPSDATKIFILERNGLLVANSSQEKTYTVSNNKAQRIRAIDSQNITVRTVAQLLDKKFGNLGQMQRDQSFRDQSFKVLIEDQTNFVQVKPWQDKYGLDWFIIIAIPESDFTAEINANTRTTILLCFLVLTLTTLIGLVTSRWISQAIDRLNQASAQIAAGDLNQTVESSTIQELEILSRSFNLMVQQMRATVSELEKNNQELEFRVEERTEKLSKALYSLQIAQARIIQTEKMSSLGQMVAGIAHEINNPISFIQGNLSHAEQYMNALTELLQIYEQYVEKSIPEIEEYEIEHDIEFIIQDLPKLLKSMQEGTERIQSIVLNLRNFSRLDEAQLKRVDLHEGLESTLLLLQHRLKSTAKRNPIKVIKQYNQLPKVECYAGQFNQVFLNILSNAIDALDEAHENPEPAIWVSTQAINSNWVGIQIRDNANGIPEEVRSKIFDPFFTTKPVGSGTGLGLFVSYQIVVDQHRGSLSCHSELKQGTEFTIEIPIYQLQR